MGKFFLLLIDKHFPKKHTIFNCNNTKVSYSCMDNMASIIKHHNAKILKSKNLTPTRSPCSCRNKAICPLNSACLNSNLVYKATVSAQGRDDKIYIRMTKHAFKTHFINHNLSFNHEKHTAKTTLLKYPGS